MQKQRGQKLEIKQDGFGCFYVGAAVDFEFGCAFGFNIAHALVADKRFFLERAPAIGAPTFRDRDIPQKPFVSHSRSLELEKTYSCFGKKRFAESGFVLLEVLIALLLFAFCLLSFTNLAALALRRSNDSYLLNLAVTLAANRAEAFDAHDVDNYANFWQQNVAALLPEGTGSVSATANGAKIKVCWHRVWQQHKFCYTLEI